MSQPITRLYESKKPALDAVSELKKSGFPSEAITLVTAANAKAPKGEPSADDGFVAALEKAGISKAASAIYAERVRGGGSVVSITPNWGTAQRAINILNSFGPIDAGLPEEALNAKTAVGQSPDLTAAAPLSESVGWPVLLTDAAPFSSYFKWPVLSKKTFYFLEDNKVSDISSKPTPLSSALNWPVLSDDATPFSNWLKRPVLSDKAAPFSDWAKWPVLSDNPTPFSSWLKFPVLS